MKVNKSIAKLLLTLTILLSNPSVALASGVTPGDVNVTDVHFGNNLYYIELENNADKEINLSGFEIVSDISIFLYPENEIEAFIVPKDYKIIFSNNISKLESILNTNINTVLVEIPKLKTNKYGGVIEIKDQLGVLIDKHSYEHFMDPDTIPDPIFITASSEKNNVFYDYFDSVFLDITPRDINKDEDKNTQIIGMITTPNDGIKTNIGSPTSPLSVNGYSISIVLVVSFVLFFLFKYFTNTRRPSLYKKI